MKKKKESWCKCQPLNKNYEVWCLKRQNERRFRQSENQRTFLVQQPNLFIWEIISCFKKNVSFIYEERPSNFKKTDLKTRITYFKEQLFSWGENLLAITSQWNSILSYSDHQNFLTFNSLMRLVRGSKTFEVGSNAKINSQIIACLNRMLKKTKLLNYKLLSFQAKYSQSSN